MAPPRFARVPGIVSAMSADSERSVGAASRDPVVRRLGQVEYAAAWSAMQRFTDGRGPAEADEIWLLEHPPVFTQGRAGRAAHVLNPGSIAVVASDRGGQVTYHGPGQLVVYVLLDIARSGLGVRTLVHRLEQAVIDLLAGAGVCGERRDGAPGVYVAGAKVAALGLRVRRGCTYHGLALNVDLDLSPFACIDPCGYPGQPVTRLSDLGVDWGVAETGERLLGPLRAALAAPPPEPRA